uniref:Uncharacterized protein n=1 Tax=Arundo donax TaxID=35708 RepID=A0A0A9HGP9_ARUDO
MHAVSGLFSLLVIQSLPRASPFPRPLRRPLQWRCPRWRRSTPPASTPAQQPARPPLSAWAPGSSSGSGRRPSLVRRSRRARMSALGSTPPSTGGSLLGCRTRGLLEPAFR